MSNRSSQIGYLKCRKLMGPQSSISVTLSMLFLAHQPWNGSILGVIARGELTCFGNSGLRVGLRRVRLTRIGRHDLGGVWKPPGERVVHLDLAKELRGASTGIKTKQQQPNPYGSPELAVTVTLRTKVLPERHPRSPSSGSRCSPVLAEVQTTEYHWSPGTRWLRFTQGSEDSGKHLLDVHAQKLLSFLAEPEVG